MAARREHALGAFIVGGSEVVENRGAFPQASLREALLNGILTIQKPPHRPIDLLFIHLTKAKFTAQRARGCGRIELTGKRKFGSRIKDPADDQRQAKRALAAVPAVDDGVQAGLKKRAQDRRNVAMWQRALDLELLRQRHRRSLPPFEQHLEPGNDYRVPIRDIGQSALLHLPLLVTERLADQNGWRRVAVGDGFNIHGRILS